MGRKVLIGVLILGCAVAAVLLIWRPLNLSEATAEDLRRHSGQKHIHVT